MTEQPHFYVEVRQGWSWVVGHPVPVDAGPWRYQWEAQEYADELNARLAVSSRPNTAPEKP